MKSIPSLVATSTVAVAATGLAFGRPHASTPPRPSSNKRKAAEFDKEHRSVSAPLSRPATSSTMATPHRDEPYNSSPGPVSSSGDPRYQSIVTTPTEYTNSRVRRRASTTRQREIAAIQEHTSEERKDSISSRGSWYRRLSTIQVSQHGSPRSSIGPDSPSLTFSHGSGAPILSSVESPTQLPPNKLVKRSTSIRGIKEEGIARSGSKSQIPSLRRPATSHQRSATLHQQYKNEEPSPVTAESPLESSPPAAALPQATYRDIVSVSSRSSWRPYFESRSTKLTKERTSGRSSDGNMDAFYSTSRRVLLPSNTTPPTLLKPSSISRSEQYNFSDHDRFASFDFDVADSWANEESSSPAQAGDVEPHKRARRSLSMHFSSPSSWISRSSSLRGSKRGRPSMSSKRYVSAPVPTTTDRPTTSTYSGTTHRRRDILDPSIYQNQLPQTTEENDAHDQFAVSAAQSRARNNSSPLPPISRLSSFNLDVNRAGLSSSSSSAPRRTPTSPIFPNTTVSPNLSTSKEKFHTRSSPPVVIHQQRSPRIYDVTASERGSTLIGSDTDTRGFTSGDEDEMDFQSDTAYDSLRTGTTNSLRTRGTPLELMFDESPPSSGSKIKSLGIHEIAFNGAFHEMSDRIVEEDEGMTTPIKARRRSDEDMFSTPIRQSIETSDNAIRSSPPSFCLATKQLGRLSLGDDEEEEDWTKDDDAIGFGNALSPPSSATNSRLFSPAVRTALADVTRSGSSLGNLAPSGERPRSVFDWSEPLPVDKSDLPGHSPRPKTVHGKQGVDRGGRATGRRGPTALHIRSQSVPVVPDVNGHREHTKLAPKFGTWGLGGKGVSEDWDNDFEFDNMDVDETENGGLNMSSSVSMLVPPAIQASQASVVGHVGQIREVCLLVEDLKRLRGLAREKGILEGPSAHLWREADGIIALAIPDEEDQTLSPPRSPEISSELTDERHIKEALDLNDLGNILLHDENANDTGTPSQSSGISKQARRRSVFSPEDDIFGIGPTVSEHTESIDSPPTRSGRQTGSKEDATEVARSVMEHMHQHRAASDPILSEMTAATPNKMPFDTTSLRDLVHRANALSRTLAEIIRRADGTLSPNRSPQVERDSSPAFTRVFTDPLANPPKHLSRSQSNNSILNNSLDNSPTRTISQRMHMMTVV